MIILVYKCNCVRVYTNIAVDDIWRISISHSNIPLHRSRLYVSSKDITCNDRKQCNTHDTTLTKYFHMILLYICWIECNIIDISFDFVSIFVNVFIIFRWFGNGFWKRSLSWPKTTIFMHEHEPFQEINDNIVSIAACTFLN